MEKLLFALGSVAVFEGFFFGDCTWAHTQGFGNFEQIY